MKPFLETHSLKNALKCLRTRDNASLTVRIVVTEGPVSTLIPIALSSMDLDGKDGDEVRSFIEASAENRFRSLAHSAAATGA